MTAQSGPGQPGPGQADPGAKARRLFGLRDGAADDLAGQADAVAAACHAMAVRFHQGGRLVVFGTGGPSADAQHVAVEFVHPVIVGKRALPAISLTADVATVTGIAERGGSPVESEGGGALAELDEAGFSGTLASNSEFEIERYLHLGEIVSSSTIMESISDAKTTRLGLGYFHPRRREPQYKPETIGEPASRGSRLDRTQSA